jgi:membrane protein DedA with SNARE-associated domain
MIDFSTSLETVIEFTRAYQGFAPALVFALGFLESLAFISLLVPSTVILVAISGLFGASGLPILPLIFAGSLGSMLGYGLSYWIGYRFKEPILARWPFRRFPQAVERSREFFARYGLMSVLLGHFFGPVRAFIPVIAGISQMPYWSFQIANAISSVAWAAVVLSPGFLAGANESLPNALMQAKQMLGL